ncbi:MAG TPA: hypothetical protein VL123_06220, partial [Candidatus Udaeobacter sp.]|nr:hypothetical protein [Candidatus Udaeobacter sp.]
FAMIAAIAMIGTACTGPKAMTSTGISMTDDPKPTMPESVPAMRPTARTKRKSRGCFCRWKPGEFYRLSA